MEDLKLADDIKKISVLAPMTRCASLEDGTPTENIINFYQKKAEEGFSRIITESAAVNGSDACGYKNGLMFYSSNHSKKWKKIIEIIHKKKSKIFLQLFHAGRLTVEEIVKSKPVAPSSIRPFSSSSFWRPEINKKIVNFQTFTEYTSPDELSLDSIKKIISQFKNACALAKETGFDGVELHGAHGYLIHLFCNKDTNNRSDVYRADDKFSFVRELVAECKDALGEKVLSYRMSQHMVDNPFMKYDESRYNFTTLTKILDETGVDIFHCSEIKSGKNLFGANKSLISIVRECTKKPIIACGQIDNINRINEVRNLGADYLAFGRNAISNDDFFYKLVSNQLEKFSYEKHFKF